MIIGHLLTMLCSCVYHAVEFTGGLALTLALFDLSLLTIGHLIRTPEQLKYFEFGGNENLYKYLAKYHLENKPATFKYKTIAAQSYREYVPSLVRCFGARN